MKCKFIYDDGRPPRVMEVRDMTHQSDHREGLGAVGWGVLFCTLAIYALAWVL